MSLRRIHRGIIDIWQVKLCYRYKSFFSWTQTQNLNFVKGRWLSWVVASYIYIVESNLWSKKWCLCGYQPLDLLSTVVTSLPSYFCHCSCALHSLLQVLLLFHSHLSLDINFTSLLIRSFSRVGMKIKGHSPFFH